MHFPALCPRCDGEAYVTRRSNSARRRKTQLVEEPCDACSGRGLVEGRRPPPIVETDEIDVAIVGGGLSGLALALGLLQRGVRCRVFERDASLESRSQGYALTLQQGSSALRGLGVRVVGVNPPRHVSLSSDGEILGVYERPEAKGRRSKYRAANVVVPRGRLRRSLFESLPTGVVAWDHAVVAVEKEGGKVRIDFANGFSTKAKLLVAADGAKSSCSRLLRRSEDEDLGIVVVLGICDQDNVKSKILRGATWQAVDGKSCRIYAMPYESSFSSESTEGESVTTTTEGNTIMWQLSWVEKEESDEGLLSSSEACQKRSLEKIGTWQLSDAVDTVRATSPSRIVAYRIRSARSVRPRVSRSTPVEDCVVFIGDSRAAMTPFKGQGANQALIDSLHLARLLRRVFVGGDLKLGEALHLFSDECIRRVTPKLHLSRDNAYLLHSPAALARADAPRADAARRAAALVIDTRQEREDERSLSERRI